MTAFNTLFGTRRVLQVKLTEAFACDIHKYIICLIAYLYCETLTINTNGEFHGLCASVNKYDLAILIITQVDESILFTSNKIQQTQIKRHLKCEVFI